jgi:hypothetical protein
MIKSNRKSLTTISQRDAVVWAVYVLGGDQRRLDTEDIAVKAHELAPGRFGWRKYPNQINLELVRVFLSDAKNPEHGALVSGSGRTGWSLTVEGLKWATSLQSRMPKMKLDRDRSESRLASVDASRYKRERERLYGAAAWIRWQSGDTNISAAEARALFRVDSYSDQGLRDEKIARLRGLFSDDPSLVTFLDAAASALISTETHP